MPRGGPRPNSGGARPGAGRKRKSTEEAQQANRELVLNCVTDDDLVAMTKTAMLQARNGDPASRQWISSWVLGSQQTVNVKHSGDVRHSLRAIPDDVLKALVAEAQSDEAE